MIELHAVHHHFGERPVLRGLDLRLSERRVGVVGGNGSGKSTFARLLNGLLVPERGRVLVDGLDTRTDARAIRRQVGFVFQNPDHQIVLPTVEEDLAFGLKNLRLPPAEVAARVTAALRQQDLEGLRHHPAHLLSGGQKQLLALSGVLVMQPRYIVFDEPTTLLDLRNKRRFVQAIVVTHDLELLHDFERVLVFDAGRIVQDDVPARAIDAYVRSMA
jgi:biotin transport system ATP-binding protein